MEAINFFESLFEEGFYRYRVKELEKDSYRFTVAYLLEDITSLGILIRRQERLKEEIENGARKDLVFDNEVLPYIKIGAIHLGNLSYNRHNLTAKENYLIVLCHNPRLLDYFHRKSINNCLREEKKFIEDRLPWYRRWSS
ncbi:MAG TPA: hypothetical protein VJB89_01290 [Candidatus Nanoarchaeia archaeon]|nr:hypothetical protein [Candidatus Nanoarchaeia archaeon]